MSEEVWTVRAVTFRQGKYRARAVEANGFGRVEVYANSEKRVREILEPLNPIYLCDE